MFQLLTDCPNPETFFTHPEWCAEEKLDGDRVILRKRGNYIFCEMRGGTCGAPENAISLGMLSDRDWHIDGEMMPGGNFIAFDILQLDGVDLRPFTNNLRREILEEQSPFPIVRRVVGQSNKRELFETIRKEKGEGVVFKQMGASYEPSRNENGLRYKLYETASFTVRAANIASVELDKDGVPMGKVAAYSMDIYTPGQTVRVRYERITAKGKLLRGKIVK